MPYGGHIYQFSTPIGGGTATVELNLPSGPVNGSRSGIEPGFGESVTDAGGGYRMSKKRVTPFALETKGRPSKWITLTCLQVLKWVEEAREATS